MKNINEKKNKWSNLIARFEKETDRNQMGLDEGIKKTVIALNALGFHTTQSCEGHVNRGRPFPWIQIEAFEKPEERFVDEKKIIAETAEKYKCSYEDVERYLNKEAYTEALRKYAENPETEEYKKWNSKNKKLEGEMQKVLQAFYDKREVPESVKLITDAGVGNFELISRENIMWRTIQKTTEEQKRKLLDFQKEMNIFGEFLKKEFFEI